MDHFEDVARLPMRPRRRRKRHSQQYSHLIHEAVMPHTNRLSLAIAGTAAVPLASLPLGITPASAAKVSEGTTSSIGVMETSPNAQQFNLKTQSASTVLVASRGRNGDGGRRFVVPAFLQQPFLQLLEFFGIFTGGTGICPPPSCLASPAL